MDTNFKVKNTLVVNSAISVNSTAIYLETTNTATINSTFYTGTANNALSLNGIPAGQYQTVVGLSPNVAQLTANNTSYFGGQLPAAYQTTAGLSSNVQTLTSNNTLFVGTVPASNVVSNTYLTSTFAPIQSPSLTGPVNIGNTVAGGSLTVNGSITSRTGSIQDSIGLVRAIPINNQTAAYTIQSSDNGQTVSITTGGVIINAALMSNGHATTIFNNSGTSQAITVAAGTLLYLAGTSFTGNRTLAQRGLATVLCVGTNICVISGAGVT